MPTRPQGQPQMVQDNISRKLAAIVSIDVVGYSRLMAEDQEAKFADLEGHRDDLIDQTITISRRHCDRAICGSPGGERQVGTGSPIGSWQS